MAKLIGTHNGHFHCDEALAVFMLKKTAQFAEADLVRTRDPAKLSTCDIVVDVGGVYDPNLHRYDHHQRGFEETFDKAHKTKLSSAGLVYKHFGHEIIAWELGLPMGNDEVDLLYHKVYDDFIEALDGNDNGINQYPSDLEPAYKEATSLPSRVGKLNPWWNQKVSDAQVDEQFLKASQLAGSELLETIHYLHKAWLPARSLVAQALAGRKEADPASGRIIILSQACPWKEHLFEMEKHLLKDESRIATEGVLYVLYPDESGNWRVQCVPKKSAGFENRKSLPSSWCGVRDEELSKLTGIPDCIFVHASGFIGGNKTKEGALAMATKALTMD
ncbi:hypothetical protein BZG36_00166 [Bifiguratus adelaidae]|uniref:Uncharacterized protein n=1 Tax=Bifiguratus adelaidae TaxID=1938954 RepID=A0A261Y856_9FUNG|nr:hypothetical protein BZG36_00166 [Bifiguratus adelaidae]